MKSKNDVIGDDGHVRVLSRRCATCIFRPDDPMYLGADYTAEVIERNVAIGSLLTCHATLPYGANPDFGPAVCNGFWRGHGMSTFTGRMAYYVLGITWIDPPAREEAISNGSTT